MIHPGIYTTGEVHPWYIHHRRGTLLGMVHFPVHPLGMVHLPVHPGIYPPYTTLGIHCPPTTPGYTVTTWHRAGRRCPGLNPGIN